MERSLIIAGFGGQGVMLIGQLLGYSAISYGKHATFYPSYGAEQRGGTANCTVVIGDEEIGSPVASEVDTLIAMNEPSLVRFESWVKPGGSIIVNSSLVDREVSRTDVKVIYIPANDMANDLGSNKISNMVILGAYVADSATISVEAAIETMKTKLANKPKFLPLNKSAILAGYNYLIKSRSE